MSVPAAEAGVQEPEGGSDDDDAKGVVTPLPMRPEELTDLGMARRLVHHRGENLRYVPELREWLAWDGFRWRPDTDGEVFRVAKEIVDAVKEPRHDRDQQRLWLRTKSEALINAMVRLASTEPGIPVRVAHLDRDPFLLGVANGTLDLRTGKLRAPRRDDLITKASPVVYSTLAKCPEWDAFLGKVTGGDKELIESLQRAAGYSLTGDVSEEVTLIPHGDGGNGKTTFLYALRLIMGDYATTIDANTLIATQHPQHTTSRLDVRGARMAVAFETDPGTRLAEAAIKVLSSNEPITGRRMYGNNVTFNPTHTMWLACNHLPEVVGTDDGIWRRLLVMPFRVKIDEDEVDTHFRERFQAEAPGILAWAVRGCLEWQEKGLRPALASCRATEEYRNNHDQVRRFVREQCLVDPGLQVKASEVREAYVKWCTAQGETARSQKAVGGDLSRMGFRSKKKVGWLGLAVKPASTLVSTGHPH